MLLRLTTVVIALAVVCHGLTSSKMEDGDFIKITSVSNGNALTATGNDATEGRSIATKPWNNESNQKWMAVEALVAGNSFLLMSKRQRYPWARFIRNGGTDPFRNRHDDLPDWTMVIEANPSTGAVTQDARDGKLYQQWRAEKIESPTGNKKYLLKNRQNNQCLQAPGTPPTNTLSLTSTTTAAPPTTTTTRRSGGFFSGMWSSIRSAFGGGSSSSNDNSSGRNSRSSSTQSVAGSSSPTGDVVLAPCDSTDVRQHWNIETLTQERE